MKKYHPIILMVQLIHVRVENSIRLKCVNGTPPDNIDLANIPKNYGNYGNFSESALLAFLKAMFSANEYRNFKMHTLFQIIDYYSVYHYNVNATNNNS